MHGLYLPAESRRDLPALVAAARLVLPHDAVATALTALRLHGLDLGADVPLYFATLARIRRRGIEILRTHVDSDTRVASVPIAFAHYVRGRSVLEGVTVLDRLRQRSAITADELAAVAGMPGLPSECARRSRDGVGSVPETRLRLMLTLANLPDPEVQGAVPLPDGSTIHPDLVYRAARLAVEYEGEHHRVDGDQWNYDIRRYELLSALGWLVIRVTADAMRNPHDLVSRVALALRARGEVFRRVRFTASWQAMFAPTRRSIG